MIKTVQFQLVDNVGDLGSREPGMGEWATDKRSERTDGIVGLMFMCPCGCGEICAIDTQAKGKRPVWLWNGDTKKPTLRPSLLRTAGCKWHGFLTDGVFKACP